MSATVHRLLSAESSRLPLWFPVFLGLGIALYFSGSAPLALWPFALALALLLMSLPFCRRHAVPLYLSVAVAAMILGVLVSGIRLHLVAAPVLTEPVFFKLVEGTVEDIQHKEKKVRLVLAKPMVETLAPEATPRRLSITLRKLDVPLAIGDRIRLPAMLFSPPTPAMPGAYDFSRLFYFEQLGAVGFSPRQPEIVAHAGTQGWQERLTALRLRIADHLVASMGKEMGAIAAALMVGDQSRVPEAIADSMRASGIYHILSISGLHMTLATGLIFFTLRLLLVMIPHAALFWPTKKLAAVGGLLGGAAYLLLAGSPVPAIRSYIMVACVLGAVLVDRRGISMYSLAWAATIILLIMPESLLTASFQLTFAATLAIIALYERYGGVLFHAHAGVVSRVLLYFFGLVLTSLAATLYTSPLAIAHFNRMSMYGIATNMLMVPLSSFWIMPSAMLAFITMPLGWDAPFLHLLRMGLEWMVAVSDMVTAVPYANIALPSPSHGGFVAIVAGGLWLALWITRLRLLGIIPVVAGLATIAFFTPYDVIVSDDAKRVAYRSRANQWVMLRGDVDSYEAETWLRSQGAETMLARTEAKKTVTELACDATSCMVTRDGRTVVVAIRKSRDNLCESGADLVVTDQYLDCPEIPAIIDRAMVSRHGAIAVRWQQDGMHLETSTAARGQWPWVKQILVEAEDAAMMPENEQETTRP